MAAQQLTPLPGYPQNWGTKNVQIGELNGPSSYSAGGQTINASQVGWGGIDAGEVMGYSYSGTYKVAVRYTTAAAPSPLKGSVSSIKLQWFVVATGVEVAGAVDLSGEVVRLFMVGV